MTTITKLYSTPEMVATRPPPRKPKPKPKDKKKEK